MPGSFSDFLENELLDHLFPTSASYSRPTNIFAGLYTAVPSDAGGGTEVSGNGYARVTLDSWNVASSGVVDNSAVITFATATASWNTLMAIGLFDTSSAGNLLAWMTVTTFKVVGTNDVARFAAGAVRVTLD